MMVICNDCGKRNLGSPLLREVRQRPLREESQA